MSLRRILTLMALSTCLLPMQAQKADWFRHPNGSISRDQVSLNALDVRDQHKDDIRRLKNEFKLKKVEVVTASDDNWYYSLQAADGRYGIADQQGNLFLPPVYTTLNYCPGVNALRSTLLFQEGKKTYKMPLSVPATQPCYIVSQDDEYKILGMDGKVIREGMEKPIFYNYYLITGTSHEDIQMRVEEDTIPTLYVGSHKDSPLHIYTLNGQEVELPSNPTIEGNMRYYTFRSPFMEIVEQADTQPKGTVTVDSDHPMAKVKVDGVMVGTTPMTLSLSGVHNITVEDQVNEFYRGVEHLNVMPGAQIERYFTLRKMPMKNEYFAGILYGTASGGIGGMVGICKRWGAYAKLLMRGSSQADSFGSAPLISEFGNKDLRIEKLQNPYSLSLSAGTMYRVCQYFYPYLGLGFAKYNGGRYPDIDFAPSRIAGLVLDVGALFSYRFLFLSVGATPMFAPTEKKSVSKYCDLHIGVGMKFNLNRKR